MRWIHKVVLKVKTKMIFPMLINPFNSVNLNKNSSIKTSNRTRFPAVTHVLPWLYLVTWNVRREIIPPRASPRCRSLRWEPGSELNVRSHPPVALRSPFLQRGETKKSLQSINRKGQTQMFCWKNDGSESLAEYSTSGICLLATTACSIFQREEISSVALTAQHRCHMAEGWEIKI